MGISYESIANNIDECSLILYKHPEVEGIFDDTIF